MWFTAAGSVDSNPWPAGAAPVGLEGVARPKPPARRAHARVNVRKTEPDTGAGRIDGSEAVTVVRCAGPFDRGRGTVRQLRTEPHVAVGAVPPRSVAAATPGPSCGALPVQPPAASASRAAPSRGPKYRSPARRNRTPPVNARDARRSPGYCPSTPVRHPVIRDAAGPKNPPEVVPITPGFDPALAAAESAPGTRPPPDDELVSDRITEVAPP